MTMSRRTADSAGRRTSMMAAKVERGSVNSDPPTRIFAAKNSAATMSFN
jgi:hypothetical protein